MDRWAARRPPLAYIIEARNPTAPKNNAHAVAVAASGRWRSVGAKPLPAWAAWTLTNRNQLNDATNAAIDANRYSAMIACAPVMCGLSLNAEEPSIWEQSLSGNAKRPYARRRRNQDASPFPADNWPRSILTPHLVSCLLALGPGLIIDPRHSVPIRNNQRVRTGGKALWCRCVLVPRSGLSLNEQKERRQHHSGTVTPSRPARRVKSAPASINASLNFATDSSAIVSPSSNRAQVMRLTFAALAQSWSDHCSAARAMRDCVGVIGETISFNSRLTQPY